jgi:hypothetical protein
MYYYWLGPFDLFFSSFRALAAQTTAAYTSTFFTSHARPKASSVPRSSNICLVYILQAKMSVTPVPCFGLIAEEYVGRLKKAMHVICRDGRWNVRHVEATKHHVSCLWFQYLVAE